MGYSEVEHPRSCGRSASAVPTCTPGGADVVPAASAAVDVVEGMVCGQGGIRIWTRTYRVTWAPLFMSSAGG